MQKTSFFTKLEIRRCAIGLVIALAALTGPLVSGAVPSIKVLVADSNGKLAYKGATNASGTFAAPKLQPGSYAVQFISNDAPKGSRYTFVVAAGSKKVVANGVAGEKLIGGGVAMKIEVGAGVNITAQVAAEDKNSAPIGRNGKAMVWITRSTGSNLPGHWAESDSAEAKEAMTSSSFSRKNLQDKVNQGIQPLDPGLKRYPGDHADGPGGM